MRNDWLRDITSLGGAPVFAAVALIALHLDMLFFARLALAFVFSYAFVVPFRLLFFRERPEKQKYANLLYKIDASSFPSQHMVRGTMLWLLVADFFATPLFWLASAAAIVLIAVTRVLLTRHHKSDVIAGAVIGAVAFLIILYLDGYTASLAASLGVA